jgi:hypothetical protein
VSGVDGEVSGAASLSGNTCSTTTTTAKPMSGCVCVCVHVQCAPIHCHSHGTRDSVALDLHIHTCPHPHPHPHTHTHTHTHLPLSRAETDASSHFASCFGSCLMGRGTSAPTNVVRSCPLSADGALTLFIAPQRHRLCWPRLSHPHQAPAPLRRSHSHRKVQFSAKRVTHACVFASQLESV